MRIIHLDLKQIKADRVELRCFSDNPNIYQDRSLSLADIAPLIQQAEEGYYVSPKLREEVVTIGRRLFQWLDGSDRWLVDHLSQALGEEVVLAIAVAEGLAHLPWEVLHDGAQFLVQRQPAVMPLRWMSSDRVTELKPGWQPRNQALNVLLMATSPLDVKPVLDYEQEEAQILKATARSGIGLMVEESGCLEELGYLVDSYERDVLDVVHLTGHATIQDGQPRFITETATGTAYYATAAEIARSLRSALPPLVFLSGCRTGQAANQGAVPSMAEQLLQLGAIAVLGWGQAVLDRDATAAAAALYEALSRSRSLVTALGETYQALIQQEARDWHLLRLYVAKTLPGSLVTPARTPGRKAAPKPSMTTEFLDPVTQQVKVPTRESFVGRRRQLQQSIRALTANPDYLAVLIHGMGGLGKSSLAARLCDRLPQFKRLVWQGRIDPQSLVHQLAAALDDRNLRQRLQDPEEELRFRLRGVFKQLAEQGAPSFLLVLDDFEQNLEAQGDRYVLQVPAKEVLEALFFAIEDTETGHRLILTSRYDFEWWHASRIYQQPLDALQGADLQKKCERLSALKPPLLEPNATEAAKQAAIQTYELQEQAKQLADGNPRLLETLHDQVLAQTQIDRATQLQQFAADPTPLRQQVLSDQLLQQMGPELRLVLSRGLVFDLPVPQAAFAAVTQATEGLERAIGLGLLEVSPDETVRVPRILPLSLPEDADALYGAAAEALYNCWWKAQSTEEQDLEVHRLAMLAGNQEIAAELGAALGHRWYNQSRFREAVKLGEQTVAIAPDYRVYHSLARSQQILGAVSVALANYQQALAACPEADEEEKAAILHNSAILYAQQGQVNQAIDLYQQVLTIDESIGNVQGKAATLGQMAKIHEMQGQVEEALSLYQQVLELAQQIGQVQYKATTLHQMAIIYAQQGQVNQAIDLYQQSLALHESIGDVQGKAATLHEMAGIYAQQGQVNQAIDLYQQSLALHESIGDVQGKAATLHQMAGIYAQQGQVNQAIDLYQQVLTIDESIGNVQGKAATLHQMAGIYAQQGQVNQAIDLYQQSLALKESIEDVQGKAATLNQLATIAFEQGETAKALGLLQQSAQALAQAGAYVDLFTVLGNLGVADEEHALIYLSQALWLGLRIQLPLPKLINLLKNFYNTVPQGDALEALLATTALFLCQTQGEDHPDLSQLQNTSLNLLANAAATQGITIESIDDVSTWMAQHQLNDADVFLPQLHQRLAEIIGDQWLFDPHDLG